MASKQDQDLSELLAEALNDFKDNEEPTKENLDSKEPESMQDLLQSLQSGAAAGKLANSDLPSDEELEKMFQDFASASLGASGASSATESSAVMPMLETMMQSILSKDLLYPPLKDLADKYPDWLADNKAKLDQANEFDKYNSQYRVVQKLVETFEQKDHKFEQVFDLMQQMQTFGHPPKDLVGVEGLPQAPGPGDCAMQ